MDIDKLLESGFHFKGLKWNVVSDQKLPILINGDLYNVELTSLLAILNKMSENGIVSTPSSMIPESIWEDTQFKCDTHGDIQVAVGDEDWEDASPGEIIYALLDLQLLVTRLKKVIDDNNLQ